MDDTWHSKYFWLKGCEFKKKEWGRLAQDGRAEGCELTSSYENTKITVNCKTAIDKKMLEPTKKDILHPKKKKKPQQGGRRGAVMIKSNTKPTGWVTHKLENNYTTGVLTEKWKSWAPGQSSQPGGLAMGEGDLRESGFEGHQVLFAGIPQDLGKQQLHSWRAHTRSCVHQDAGKKAVTS